MAFVVDDINAEHARFEREGLGPNPVKEMRHAGEVLATFFFVSDPDGYRIEVLQQAGRYH
jgi:lactoylglutathione lyase